MYTMILYWRDTSCQRKISSNRIRPSCFLWFFSIVLYSSLLDLALRRFRNSNWLCMPTFLSLTNISFCSAQFGNTTDLSSYLDLLLLLYSKHCYTTTNPIFLQKQIQNLCWINFTTPKNWIRTQFIHFFLLPYAKTSERSIERCVPVHLEGTTQISSSICCCSIVFAIHSFSQDSSFWSFIIHSSNTTSSSDNKKSHVEPLYLVFPRRFHKLTRY